MSLDAAPELEGTNGKMLHMLMKHAAYDTLMELPAAAAAGGAKVSLLRCCVCDRRAGIRGGLNCSSHQPGWQRRGHRLGVCLLGVRLVYIKQRHKDEKSSCAC